MKRTPAEQREHERLRVAHHYEHDPEIFRLVLGRQRAYSVGVFAGPDDDLETAQDRKLARIREKLDLRPDETVLDVGCGWGSVLLHLAEHTRAKIHGITLSAQQRDVTQQRARDLGAGERVRVEVRHVEELDLPAESVDAVVFSGSIVHMHDRAAVHRLVGRVLRPGGRLLISDCYFPKQERGDRNSEATQHIFVTALGYCRLIPLSEELSLVEDAGLDVTHVEDLTENYVRTVDRWVDNVRRHRKAIDAMAPGFARLLQTYMTVGRMSFHRRSALEYMILAVKGRPRVNYGAWPVTGTP
ncbi:MAG TPA: class I SAM-dependent methyltransferase [Polyangiaceae bacterium]